MLATMAESKEPDTQASLKQQMQELRHSNAVLQTENEMFQSFLSRMDSGNQTSHLASKMDEKEENMEKKKEHGASEGTSQESATLLNPEQKYYIAACEFEELKKELAQFSISSTGNVQYYKAVIEDSNMRLAEIKREKHDFEKFIAKTHQTTWLSAQRARKIISYIEHKIKAKRTLTERMRRKNAFLRTENQKQQLMVHRKEQMQDHLFKIDLDRLKQQNAQAREEIQKLQEQILYQRMLVRKSHKGLNIYKERLRREMRESELLSRKIASREEKLSKIREQQQKVEKERAQAEALNQKLKEQLDNFRVPEVMKYVECKAENDQIKRTIKVLERKAKIAEIVSKTKKIIPKEASGCSKNTDL